MEFKRTLVMKVISYVIAMLVTTGAPIFAQTGVTGSWRAEGVGTGPWTVMLRAEGTRLSGKVSACTSLPVEVYEGRIDGNTVRFKCRSLDGDRVVTLRGTVSADEIVFTWEKQVRDGGALRPSDIDLDLQDANAHEMFGASTPLQFTAKRIQDAGTEFAAALNVPEKGVKVEGTLFLPPNVGQVRAVIVLLNSGTSWEGMGGAFYLDSELRRLSASLNCALLLPRITSTSMTDSASAPAFGHVDVLRNAGAGGSEGLLKLLERLATESQHPEVAAAPLLLWGHSRTGHFAATFAALHSQRIVAVVGYHSGAAGLAGHDLEVLKKIPVLILMAKADVPNAYRPGFRMPPAETVWRSGRAVGAPWTFGIEPDAVHQNPNDLKKANAVVIPWIAAVFRQRLSPDGGNLRVVTDGAAWLGNIQTGDISPSASYSGPEREATWLPDEPSAQGWRVAVGAAK
jgi:hypothetical protein